jgi:hypothetical protein
MLGLTLRDVKRIHQQLVADIQQTYATETSLLEDEARTIELLKKYEKRIIVKEIFHKARWRKDNPEDYKAYDPANTFAKIIYNFYSLTSRLHNNIITQQHFLEKKLRAITEEYVKEKRDATNLPLFKKEFKKIDKKALYTLRRLNSLLKEINECCWKLSEGFLDSYKMAELFSSDPSAFHKLFLKICKSIDFKNETLEHLHKIMKYETELQKQLCGRWRENILEQIKE